MAIINLIAEFIFKISAVIAFIVACIIFINLAKSIDFHEGPFTGIVAAFYFFLSFALFIPLYFLSDFSGWKGPKPNLINIYYISITIIICIINIIIITVILRKIKFKVSNRKMIYILLILLLNVFSSSWFGYTLNLMIFLANINLLYILAGILFLALYEFAPFILIILLSEG